MTIRDFTSGDAPAVVSLHVSVFASYGWTESDYVNLSREANGILLVAEAAPGERAGLAGFIALRQLFTQAEILNLAVDSAYRRQGVATALLRSACERLKKRNVERTFLEVRPSNATGLAFYAAAGFTRISLRKDYYTDPREDAFVLQLPLGANPGREPS